MTNIKTKLRLIFSQIVYMLVSMITLDVKICDVQVLYVKTTKLPDLWIVQKNFQICGYGTPHIRRMNFI